MFVRAVLALSLALSLAACATGPQNTLAQDKRDSLRIDKIEVSFAPDATIMWPDAQGAPEEAAAKLAYLEQKAIEPIRSALDAGIKPAFRGTDPAILKVRIRTVRIPAAAVRIILANIPYSIKADLELVDARSGKALLAASNFDAFSQSFGGVVGILEAAVADPPIIRLSKAFAHVLATWLKTGVSSKFA